MEEPREPRDEGQEGVPGQAGPEPGQEATPPSELPAAEQPAAGEGPEAPPVEPALSPPAVPASGGQRSPLGTAAAIALVAVVAVGIFVGGFFTHAATDSDGAVEVQVGIGPTPGAVQPTPAPQPTVELVEATVDDDPAKGPEDAAVTVIEFSDFQCPFCARFVIETLPLLMENYGDRIHFVFRDFPLTSIHPYALKASEAAECADDQDAFWEYHDLLFENQQALTGLLDPVDPAAGLAKIAESLKDYAATLELDTAAFDDCLDSGKYTEEVQKDVQDGAAAGVRGTPAFFVNGQLISGAQPYQVFEAAIEAAFAAAGE